MVIVIEEMREGLIGRQQVLNRYLCPSPVVNKFTGEMSRTHRVRVDEANGEWPCHKISL